MEDKGKFQTEGRNGVSNRTACSCQVLFAKLFSLSGNIFTSPGYP